MVGSWRAPEVRLGSGKQNLIVQEWGYTHRRLEPKRGDYIHVLVKGQYNRASESGVLEPTEVSLRFSITVSMVPEAQTPAMATAANCVRVDFYPVIPGDPGCREINRCETEDGGRILQLAGSGPTHIVFDRDWISSSLPRVRRCDCCPFWTRQ